MGGVGSGAKPQDISGQRFGRLVAVERVGRRWRCDCDCGGSKLAPVALLRSLGTRSCGCLRRENASALAISRATHGDCLSIEYRAWACMIKRCENPKYEGFAHYGGRGISVCSRWRSSYESFLEDMGRRPSPTHSLDRIDVDGNYEPSNCRWATRKEQQRNRRNNHRVEVDGQSMTVTEAAERAGLDVHKVMHRLRHGWSVQRALTRGRAA